MCGIAGYISSSNKFNGEKMIRTLCHRGPDNLGEYEQKDRNFYIYLGHTRLSIIDLTERGHQPMSTPDEEIYIVFNGEIYNFQQLKSENLKDYNFRSRTDTEVILYLYEKFGMRFLEELNGDFAISIFDKRNLRLYLIRDRIGVKPLYYSFMDNDLLFGSEIKAILASGLSFPLSKKNIQKYFVFKYVPGDETLFEDIYRVKPGHYLEFDILNKRLECKKYWTLDKLREYENLSYEESNNVLYDLLKDSVEKRIISDVPVGTFLSGGLDSSAISYFLRDNSSITHYCAKKTKQDIKREGTSPDFDYASKLAGDWDLRLYPIEISSSTLTLDQIRKTVFYSDDLIADGSQIPSYLITKESSKSSRVMLSGMGGDELFFGYASHLLTLLSLYIDNVPQFASHSLAYFLRSLPQGKGSFKSYRRYLHKLGKYYHYPGYKYGIYSIVGDFESSKSVFNFDQGCIIEFLNKYFFANGNPFDNQCRFEIDNFLVKNLHYLDRMSMANSVEGRVPYLDHRIVEFAFSLRRSFKLSNYGRYKRLLKDTFKSKLPFYIIKRKKAGFGMPLRSIFSSQNKIKQLLDREFFSGFQEFSLENIDRVIHNHLTGREDNSSIIYALISFQEWYKIFVC